MPRCLPERTHVDTQECRRFKERSFHSAAFQENPLKEEVRERLKVKILQDRRKIAVAEKLSEAGDEKNK